MKVFKFLCEFAIVILLWASIWGLLDLAIESVCENDRRKRFITYMGILIFLGSVYVINPDHFIHL